MANKSWESMFPPLSAAVCDKVKAKREGIWKRYGQWFAPRKTDYHQNLYSKLKDGKEHNMVTDFTDESLFGLANEIPTS